jgi:hypothetical protein
MPVVLGVLNRCYPTLHVRTISAILERLLDTLRLRHLPEGRGCSRFGFQNEADSKQWLYQPPP